jgi:hypothetical protein
LQDEDCDGGLCAALRAIDPEDGESFSPERLLWILSQQWSSAVEISIVMECVKMMIGQEQAGLDAQDAARLVEQGLVEALADFTGARLGSPSLPPSCSLHSEAARSITAPD